MKMVFASVIDIVFKLKTDANNALKAATNQDLSVPFAHLPASNVSMRITVNNVSLILS